MATVGINFGAATSGAGFDVTATVTSILAIQSAIETPWKNQLTALKTQDTAFSALGTNLSALSTALGALTSFDGVLAGKQGSSSDTSVLSLSAAGTTAVAGSHTILVSSLASTSSVYTDRVAASDVLTGSLSVQIGSGTAQTIAIPTGGQTLAELASTINNGTYGVTASVVTDTQGSRLSLVSATSGAAGQLTTGGSLTDATTSVSVAVQVGQTGADAQLTVDGLATTSASNTVTSAIPGVTFQLLKSAPGTPVQVQITNDNASIKAAVQTFVTAYNAVAANIQTQEGKDASGNAQPLFGNPILQQIQNSLSSGILGGAASGKVSSTTQLGLTLSPDGTLAFDPSALDTQLNTNFSDVTGFLQATGSFGLSFGQTLNGLSSSSAGGGIFLAIKENSNKETSLTKSVSDEDARLATAKTALTLELNLANQILESIPSQLNQNNELYSALTGYNQQK